jgi:soluble lytic murein transglycosylase
MKRPLPVLISISILFFAATLACSFEAGPAPASTDLPRPTGTLPPTATATSTPTPLPTATPLPRTRITEAAQALHDGDYATALADYQAVLAGSTEADLIEQARLGLATIALQAGDNSGAIDQLQQFVQAYPASPQLADAWFGLGEANYAQANWQAAIDAYQEYLNLRGDLISAYVNERIGDAYSQMNDLENAASAYQTALAQATSNTNNANLREKLALTYRLLKRYNDALTQYDAILSFAQQSGYRAQVLYRAGQTLLDAGDTAGGYQRFVELVDNYPDRSDAYQALVAVVNAGVEVDEFQRGLVDYYATQYDAAVAAFDRFIAANKNKADAYYYLGMTYRAAGNTPAAIKSFNTVITNYPASAHWGDAWIDKAAAQANSGDLNSALNTLKTFVTQHADSAQAPDALWRAAGLLEAAGDYQRAIDFNVQLQADYPNSQYASDALFDAGLDAYRAADATTAISVWQTLSNTYPLSEYYSASLFWQGKALREGNQPAEADQLLNLAAQNTLDYYGLRAADVLNDNAALPTVSAQLDLDPDTGRSEAEQWLAQWLQVDPQVLRSLPASVTSDSRFRRGEEFWRLGKTAQAADDFEALRQSNADNAAVLYPLAIYFRDVGLYRSSILAAGSLIRLSPAKTSDQAPAFLARLMYPIYYANLVVPEAQANNLDPLTIFALIRQESLFEGVATSSAFANGLMQIVPATAEEIAHQLHWPNYQVSDLYRPLISIKFGTYYLARQRDYLNGNMIAAWAAYNGGPGNSSRWLKAANGDTDLFVETISLPETRLYVERLRENLGMYQKLYGK